MRLAHRPPHIAGSSGHIPRIPGVEAQCFLMLCRDRSRGWKTLVYPIPNDEIIAVLIFPQPSIGGVSDRGHHGRVLLDNLLHYHLCSCARCRMRTHESEVVTSTPYITYGITTTFYTTFTLPGTPPFFFPTTTSSLTSTTTTTSDPFLPITYTTYFVEDNVCPNTNACYAIGAAGSMCEFTAQLFQLSVAT